MYLSGFGRRVRRSDARTILNRLLYDGSDQRQLSLVTADALIKRDRHRFLTFSNCASVVDAGYAPM